jgi:hypothetical protein
MRRPWKLKARGWAAAEAESQLEKNKTITITRETHEVFIVTRPTEHSIRVWCAECALEVVMLTPEEITAVTGTPTRAVYLRAEAGELHFLETEEGALLVCSNSIFSPRKLP